MDDRDIPNRPRPKKVPGDRKNRTSYLAVGIVFTAVGIGMLFGDSSAWIPFLVLGITFLAVSASPMGKKQGTNTKHRRPD